MNYWPLITIGVSILGSIVGSYLAVRVELARIDERLKAAEKRLERHSNEFNELSRAVLFTPPRTK